MYVAQRLVAGLLQLYALVVLGRVLASWLDPQSRHPISQLLVRLTEPVLAPIRRLLPRGGPIDFSTLVVFIILQVLARLVLAF